MSKYNHLLKIASSIKISYYILVYVYIYTLHFTTCMGVSGISRYVGKSEELRKRKIAWFIRFAIRQCVIAISVGQEKCNIKVIITYLTYLFYTKRLKTCFMCLIPIHTKLSPQQPTDIYNLEIHFPIKRNIFTIYKIRKI